MRYSVCMALLSLQTFFGQKIEGRACLHLHGIATCSCHEPERPRPLHSLGLDVDAALAVVRIVLPHKRLGVQLPRLHLAQVLADLRGKKGVGVWGRWGRCEVKQRSRTAANCKQHGMSSAARVLRRLP